MIIKNYHIIAIGITQISDNTPNPNFTFFILKYIEMDQNGKMDLIGPNWTK